MLASLVKTIFRQNIAGLYVNLLRKWTLILIHIANFIKLLIHENKVMDLTPNNNDLSWLCTNKCLFICLIGV